MRRRLSFDLETFNIAPGRGAPPVVCGASWDRETSVTYEKRRFMPYIAQELRRDDTDFDNQNISFDLAAIVEEDPSLLSVVFKLYDEDRIYDPMVADQLIQIARGRHTGSQYSLAAQVKRHFKEVVGGKEDGAWRTRYHELDGTEIEEYPAAARDYVIDDPIYAQRLRDEQERIIHRDSGGRMATLPTFYDQMRAKWAFQLMGAWGTRVDPYFLDPLEAQLRVHVDAAVKKLIEMGVCRPDGTEDQKYVKRLVVDAYGDPQPRSEPPPSYLDLREAILADDDRAKFYSGLGSLDTKKRKLVDQQHALRAHYDETELSFDCDATDALALYLDDREANKRSLDPSTRVALDAHELVDLMGGYKPSLQALEWAAHAHATDLDALLTTLKQPLAKLVKAGFTKDEAKDLKKQRALYLLSGAFVADYEVLQYVDSIRDVDKIPRTDTKGIGTDKEVCEESYCDKLLARAEVSADKKILSTYVPLLRQGVTLPINPRWNVLVKSARSSCSGPNLQNQPRLPGVRECIVPRPGFVFIACDYAVAELRSLAQVLLDMFGQSKMADAIKAGLDLHNVFAASLMGISYEEFERLYNSGDKFAKAMRNLAKAMNFGVPGGLGAEKFVKFAKASYGIIIAAFAPEVFWTVDKPEMDVSNKKSVKKACEDIPTKTLVDIGIQYFKQVLKPKWIDETYPEMRWFFKQMGIAVAGDEAVTYTHPRTGYIRGGVFYCAACNQNFQHLTAMGMKAAMYEVARECYLGVTKTGAPSVLLGCRPMAMIHDELVIEAPEGHAHEAALRVAEIMETEMVVYTPDLPSVAEAALMRRWRKGADPVFRDGRLIPWEDRELKKYDLEAILTAESVWQACVDGGVEPDRAEFLRAA